MSEIPVACYLLCNYLARELPGAMGPAMPTEPGLANLIMILAQKSDHIWLCHGANLEFSMTSKVLQWPFDQDKTTSGNHESNNDK